ncbi:MAG: hypothetical protein ACRD1K_21400 [Acidimicrobiales bacterium]
MDTLDQIIGDWRRAAGEEAYFSASRVQGRLFDLYGELGPGPARHLVETWLTLTIERDLFAGSELVELLDDLQGRLAEPVST